MTKPNVEQEAVREWLFEILARDGFSRDAAEVVLKALVPALARKIAEERHEAKLYGVELCRESMTETNYERIIGWLEAQRADLEKKVQP